VAPAAAVPVLLERLENGAWVPIMTVQSTAAGTFAATLDLPPGSVRASVQGPDGAVQSSAHRSIAVVRRMTLAMRCLREAARKSGEKSMVLRLGAEFKDDPHAPEPLAGDALAHWPAADLAQAPDPLRAALRAPRFLARTLPGLEPP